MSKSWTTTKAVCLSAQEGSRGTMTTFNLQAGGAVHPGEILLEEFLRPMDITPYRLAKDLDIPVTRVHEITKCNRGITADTALRLAKYFGMTADFWMRLQADYDLRMANSEKNLAKVKVRVSEQEVDGQATKRAVVSFRRQKVSSSPKVMTSSR